MAKKIHNVKNVTLTDNSEAVKRAMQERADVILEAIGQKAASNARGYLRASEAIDTGNLRNSVAYAVSGGPAITKNGESSWKADRGKGKGTYKGTAPNDKNGQKVVYIGTGVEYAVWVETGTRKIGPRPFLKPAAENHKDQYKAIAEQYAKQE